VICTCHMGCGYGLDTTRPRTCPVHGWDDDAVFEAVRLAGIGLRDLAGWRERALAAEARVRDLEETVGELVALVDERCGCGTVFERYCSGCDFP
jgi:hypothetical protein